MPDAPSPALQTASRHSGRSVLTVLAVGPPVSPWSVPDWTTIREFPRSRILHLHTVAPATAHSDFPASLRRLFGALSFPLAGAVRLAPHLGVECDSRPWGFCGQCSRGLGLCLPVAVQAVCASAGETRGVQPRRAPGLCRQGECDGSGVTSRVSGEPRGRCRVLSAALSGVTAP